MRDDAEEIKKISIRLKQIETSLNPKQKWFKEKLDSLNDALLDLTEIRFCLNVETKDKMFKMINRNLPDRMKLEEVNENINDILFDKRTIGNIEVLEDYMPELRIRVTVNDNTEEFDIRDYIRMYSIISFINTKFNYKQPYKEDFD